MRIVSFLALLFFTQVSFANSLRLDIGHYSATEWWMASEEKKFQDFSNGTADAKTSTLYEKITYAASISDKTSIEVFLELAQAKMENFSAAGENSGYGQKGVSQSGFRMHNLLYASEGSQLDLSYGISASGETSPYKFVSIHDGQTRYQLGLSYGHLFNSGKLDMYLNYVLRPGDVEVTGTDGNGDQFKLEVPDLLEVGAAYYHFFHKKYFALLSVDHYSALDGLDIGPSDAQWVSTRSAGTEFVFPATKEVRTAASIGIGLFMNSKSSLDLTFTQVLAGRNTDKGQNINLGLSYNLE